MENEDLVHSLTTIKDKDWKYIIKNCINKKINERWNINTLFDNVDNLTLYDTQQCVIG